MTPLFLVVITAFHKSDNFKEFWYYFPPVKLESIRLNDDFPLYLE
jgi:hypothetical protein